MNGSGRLGSWLSVRHSLRVEAAGALTLYGLYELARALVAGIAASLAALLTRRPATARQLGDGLGGHNGCLVLERG